MQWWTLSKLTSKKWVSHCIDSRFQLLPWRTMYSRDMSAFQNVCRTRPFGTRWECLKRRQSACNVSTVSATGLYSIFRPHYLITLMGARCFFLSNIRFMLLTALMLAAMIWFKLIRIHSCRYSNYIEGSTYNMDKEWYLCLARKRNSIQWLAALLLFFEILRKAGHAHKCRRKW